LLDLPNLRYIKGLYIHQRARGPKRLSEVIINEDENFERALKRFKKKCEKAGILADLRKHRHYEKPSERRKRKMNAAMRKNRRTRAM
jgi:small subunit ribosomal protein S21